MRLIKSYILCLFFITLISLIFTSAYASNHKNRYWVSDENCSVTVNKNWTNNQNWASSPGGDLEIDYLDNKNIIMTGPTKLDYKDRYTI